MKITKKILLLSSGFLLTLGLVIPFVTSCSSAPSALQTITSKFNDLIFKVNNQNITCDAGVDGFKTMPAFDKNNFPQLQARSVFEVVGAFTTWMHGIGNSIATVISRKPASKNFENPLGTFSNGIDYALASYLGSGAETYRLGLYQVSCSTDVNDIKNFVKQPVDNDTSTPVVDKQDPTYGDLTFSNLKLEFRWWRSTGGSTQEWITDNNKSTFDKLNKNAFENAKSAPQLSYSLSLSNIKTFLNPYTIATIDGKKYWVPSGKLTIVDKDNVDNVYAPFYFGDSRKESNRILNLIGDANKVAAGDKKSENFDDFLKTENGRKLKNDLATIIAG